MASKGNKLIFANAEKARDAIVESQKKEIASLYQQWADEIGERAKYYSHKSTSSSVVSERQMKELQKQLTETSHQVSNEIYKNIKGSIYTVSDAVVKDNVEWLKQFGFSESGLNAAFSSVPDQIVRMLVTGQIYEGGWNLSSRIWSDNEQTMRTAYQIVAKGMAENRPIYDIAKELEKYVQPGAAKSWNPYILMKNTKTGEWERKKIYKRQVDYNAQRLARTLVQHGYQQSFIAVTEKNPFVLKYQWSANGSRPCPLCQDRDGQIFEKGDLPMDHPNGQCTMIPVIDDQMIDKLADWFNSPDGTYPEIDEFSKNFGYQPIGTVKDFIDKYGTSTKSPSAWYNSLTPEQKLEATALKNASGLTWNQWYEQNIYVGDGSNLGGKKQPVFNAAQEKYLKPYGFSPTNMPTNFDDWSHKISYEQAAEILQSMGTSWSDPHPYQKLMQYYNQNLAGVSSKVVKPAKAAKIAATPTTATTTNGAVGDWISLMRKQTESGMLNTEAGQFARMTQSQIDGIRTYSGSSYQEMNSYLRYLATGMSEDDARRRSGISERQMDALINAQAGLRSAALTQDTYLRRGTDLGDLAGFMPGDFRDNKNSLRGMSVDELRNRFVGTQGTYAGFTSTSSLYNRGFSGDVEVIFHAPAGTEATSIMTISNFGTGEGETLLNAGTKVEITAIEESDGHMGSDIRVYMEIIGKK